MKSNLRYLRHFTCSLIFLISIFLTISCENVLSEKDDANKAFFEANPPTITWKDTDQGLITSFQADVEVYAMNNRRDQGATLSNRYRMSLKTIGDTQFVRLDLDPEFNGQRARSLISNGREIILIDSITEDVQFRMPVSPNEVSSDLAFLRFETAVSRLDLTMIRSESNRLAFEIIEDSSTRLILDLPSRLFQASPGDSRISTRIAFDTVNETLESIETVTMLEDGSTITTTMQPMYEEENGNPVKIGMISIIDTSVPNLIQGMDPDVEYFDSAEEIPELSEEALKAMQAEGSIQEANPPVFGDPADLSHQDTIIELYREIEINAVSDSIFKLLAGE